MFFSLRFNQIPVKILKNPKNKPPEMAGIFSHSSVALIYPGGMWNE